MKVLVTGAQGQVGAALMRLAPRGVQLAAVSRAELDITDGPAVREWVARAGPDVIINAAAYTAVDRAEDEPERARQANEMAPRHLAEYCAERGARLIHISTDYVFDGEATRPYPPNHATRPLSVYGRTKLAGEQAVRAILPERSVVLRTSWVYAATGQNFVRTMLRLMNERGTVRVVSDQIGSPTAAQSIAEVIWKFIELPALRGIYHWTDAGVASWYDFAVAIAEESAALGRLPRTVQVIPIKTEEYPTPATRPRFSLLDTRETVTATAVSPRHWRENLRDVLGEIAVA